MPVQAHRPGAEVNLPADPYNTLPESSLVPAHGHTQHQQEEHHYGSPSWRSVQRQQTEEVVNVDEQRVLDEQSAVTQAEQQSGQARPEKARGTGAEIKCQTLVNSATVTETGPPGE